MHACTDISSYIMGRLCWRCVCSMCMRAWMLQAHADCNEWYTLQKSKSLNPSAIFHFQIAVAVLQWMCTANQNICLNAKDHSHSFKPTRNTQPTGAPPPTPARVQIMFTCQNESEGGFGCKQQTCTQQVNRVFRTPMLLSHQCMERVSLCHLNESRRSWYYILS